MHDYIDKFGDYRQELISLMTWIGLHITKGITYGGVLQMIKCVMQLVTIEGGCFSGKVMDDWLKPYTGGATT